MAEAKTKQHWKFTKDTTEKTVRKPAWKTEKQHEPAEVVFQPYKYKPTAVESWLGYSDEEKEEDGM